jgi:hypothetical protein
MENQYYISDHHTNGGFNFSTNKQKVFAPFFYEMLDSKLNELIGDDRKDKFDELKIQVESALKTKKPVTILDKTFEIKIKK